ncbi:hypothetical protein [Luteolibacter soli]|uniref:Uncharacterized protein n=1 Tax=Luteolibacter soli TaxID=3135280 RepID=A0ABU9AUE0_9BACT
MNFAELLRFMHAEWKAQAGFLDPIPENAAERNFSRENRVSKVIDLYFRSISPIDDVGGSEAVDEWQFRTGLSDLPRAGREGSPFWKSVIDLATVLNLIKESPRDVLLTKQGLRSSQEWRLVRKLAARVMEEAGYPHDKAITNLDDLWARLGGEEF